MIRAVLQLRTLLVTLLVGGVVYGGFSTGDGVVYDTHGVVGTSTPIALASSTPTTPSEPVFIVTHIATPPIVKAAYMTSCIASGRKLRAPMVALVDTTELNSVVIDIKDYTGMISFDAGDSRFVVNTKGCHVPDMKEFIGELHKKNIYVIGRVTVMQDTVYPKTHPDAAVKKKSDKSIWKDKKGLTFIDPGATEYWQYMIDLGKASYAIGFDEINYDYIRFPSDGDMSDIYFSRTGSTTKPAMMKRFYQFLGGGMRDAGIPTSADLFGMTTTNTDDLNIGQVLESALVSFDFVAPMVYPSHYPPNFNGWKDPNLVPYEIVKFSMSRAVARADELEKIESGWKPPTLGTTTPDVTATSSARFIPKGIYARKLRAWIQDFNYGKMYTEADVRAQKKAVYDSGLTSWMLWDPENTYTASALDKE